jgi:hypothetical protein
MKTFYDQPTFVGWKKFKNNMVSEVLLNAYVLACVTGSIAKRC